MERASETQGRPLPLLLLLAVVTFAVDQLTKFAALRLLQPYASVPLLGGWVRLTLTHNRDSAFRLLPGGWWLLAVGAAVSSAILLYALLGRSFRQHPEQAVPLGLVLGGSFGNLLDRLRTHGVWDFIDLRVWPVFNLADLAVTVGFAVLAVQLVRRR